LIENADGTPLRPANLGLAHFPLPGDIEHFPDTPILYFENVPFFIVSGYRLHGTPEPAIKYLNEALKFGRWKSVEYKTIDETKLYEIATRLIEQYSETSEDPAKLERWIRSQIGPPRPDASRVP
jgi:hypothetical protein